MKNSATPSLPQRILAHARTLPEGGLVSPKDFLHLAGRGTLDKAFARLAGEERLFRVSRGLYTLPVQGHYGVMTPSSGKLLAALSMKTEETFVVQGGAAANLLGLSPQVPMCEIYLTSGRSRTFRRGRYTFKVKHAPPWQLLFGNDPAGLMLRALDSYGPRQAWDVAQRGRDAIPMEEWKRLAAASSELPSWLAKIINEICYA